MLEEQLSLSSSFRGMKGEIDNITCKIETLEMNQETAHKVYIIQGPPHTLLGLFLLGEYGYTYEVG